MDTAVDLIRRAREVRERLRHPPNAVKDIGIDLKRHKRIPPAPEKPQPKPVLLVITKSPEAVLEYGFQYTLPLFQPKELKFDVVIQAVSDYFSISVAELKGPSRRKWVILPRHIAAYLATEYCLGGYKSSTVVGRLLGKRDHSTILHARWKIQALIKTDPQMRETIEILEQMLFGHAAQPTTVPAESSQGVMVTTHPSVFPQAAEMRLTNLFLSS